MTSRALISKIHCRLSANQKGVGEFNAGIIIKIKQHLTRVTSLQAAQGALTSVFVAAILNF